MGPPRGSSEHHTQVKSSP